MAGDGGLGLLLVTMEPQAVSEEEFNDWYDSEHTPERAACPGFRSALRYVCVAGWPRYMALYDLDSLAVLQSEGYTKLAGKNFTPWSKRVLPRVQGQLRVEATQILPGPAVTVTQPTRGRVTMLRFRGAAEERAVLDGLARCYADRPGTAQLRAFRIENAAAGEYLALVEHRLPDPAWQPDPAAFAPGAGTIDIANHYSPYWRRGHLPGVM